MKKPKKVNLFDRSFKEVRDTMKVSTKKELQYELDHKQDREWKNEDDKLNNSPKLHLDDPDHALPQTRRDFLAAGIVGTTVAMTLPSIASAVECKVAAGGGALTNLPLVMIEGAGGASFAGDNVTVGTNSPDQMFTDYENYGVPNGKRADVNMPFGGAGMKFHSVSQLAAGIIAGTGNDANVLGKMDGCTIACSSNDDSGNNSFNVSQALVQAGMRGELIGAIGSRGGNFGGRSTGINDNPATRSTQIAREQDAAALVSPGLLATSLGNDNNQVNKVLRSIASMTEMQSNSVSAAALNQATKDAVSCGAQGNIKIIGGSAALNVYSSGESQGTFGGDPNGRTEEAVATAAYMTIMGKAGVATVSIGGCDYHNRGRNTQDAKDREIGRSIGQCMKMASLANRPMMVYLFSDGSTSANTSVDGPNGMFEARSDNGSYASLHMFFFDPTAKPAMNTRQLGAFSAGGVVPGATPWAGNPATAAKVVAVNYLHAAKKLDKVGVLGGLGFNVADVLALSKPLIA